MISDELLRIIEDDDYIVGDSIEFDGDNTIEYTNLYHPQAYYGINIYELAHKCKEWARKKGYQIWSGHQCRGDIFACSVYIKDDYANDDDFEADTEPEAIFKACEWILEQKDKE